METIGIYELERLRSGDKSVFGLLYKRYANDVYRLAFRFLKDSTLSEEIVQETFIKLWINRGKIDVNGNLWLYLYVIAKRLSLNYLRKIHNSAELVERLLLNIENCNNATEEEILAADIEKFTEKLLSSLPPQQQLIFKFSRVDGLTHKEIAEKLNISPNTVKNHIVAALKTLKANLKCADVSYALAFILWFD